MSFGEPNHGFRTPGVHFWNLSGYFSNRTQKCKVHAAPCSFWSVSPTVIFEICPDIFSTDLESVMVLSQSTDFKSVLWPFWTDLKSVTFGATHPYRLQICHPQIVSYFFNRFQICRGFWGGQISKLHGKTDFKSVRSAKVQISNLSTPEPPYRFQICHLHSFESCRYKIGK